MQNFSCCSASNATNFIEVFYMVLKLLLMNLNTQYVLFLRNLTVDPFKKGHPL